MVGGLSLFQLIRKVRDVANSEAKSLNLGQGLSRRSHRRRIFGPGTSLSLSRKNYSGFFRWYVVNVGFSSSLRLSSSCPTARRRRKTSRINGGARRKTSTGTEVPNINAAEEMFPSRSLVPE